MSESRVKTDNRKRRRRHRLPQDARCLLCGYTALESLRAIGIGDIPRSLLEAHHVAGEAYEPDLVVSLCLNHHAEATEAQRISGMDFTPPPAAACLDRLANMLASIGSFLMAVGQTLLRMADDARDELACLDVLHPRWRAELEGMS